MSETPRNPQFSIEPGVELSLQFDRIGRRLNGVFLGLDPGDFLIVRVDDEQLRKINPSFLWKSGVVCRYLQEGTVYGFRANFLDSISFPAQILFLGHPEKLECVELREHPRSNCFLPARFDYRDLTWDGFVLDISEGGCRCTLQGIPDSRIDDIKIGDSILFRTRFPSSDEEQSLSCVIRTVENEAEGLSLGLRFQKATPSERSQVVQYILHVDTRLREKSFHDFQAWQTEELPHDLLALYIARFPAEVGSEKERSKVQLDVLAGIDFRGHRLLLEAYASPQGEARHWPRVFKSVSRRGLARCLWIVAEELPGLAKALAASFPESDVQHCFQGLLSRVRKESRPEDHLEEKIGQLAHSRSLRSGLELFSVLMQQNASRYPDLISELEGKSFHYLMFLNLPVGLRPLLSDTRLLESLFSLLEGFRLARGGCFRSENELRISAFWSFLRFRKDWERPLEAVEKHRAVLFERFQQIFLRAPAADD